MTAVLWAGEVWTCACGLADEARRWADQELGDGCRRCIEKTGEPCFWWEPDLCSACYPVAGLRDELGELVAGGTLTQAEADETCRFMDELSDKELRSEVSTRDALAQLLAFTARQMARRRAG